MKLEEAKKLASNINQNTQHSAEITRILPVAVDPIVDNDDGWDLIVTVHGNEIAIEGRS